MSRRHILHSLVCLFLFLSFGMQRAEASPRCLAQETTPDSLADRASLLAARGLVGELRPLYQRAGQTFPPSVRLYCELAIAQADHRWEHVVGCVDSLTTTYSASLDLKGLIALCLLKAETLHRLGHFEAMADYASERLAYFQGRRVKTSILAPFRSLAKKGRRLSGSDLRTQMLQKVEMGDAYALLQYPDSQIAALDNYARWRCRLLLAVAYNRPDVAASTADSLLFLKADSLDTNDYISCVHTAARVLMVQGRWKDLNRMATKLMQRKKNKLLWERYLRLSKTFLNCGPTTVSRPEGQTFALDLSPVWPPLVSVALSDDYQLFTLSTGTSFTIITEADARAAGVVVSNDTVSVVSSVGVVRAVTAVADSMAFGPVVIRHPMVYVAVNNELAGDSVYKEMVRTLGLVDLSRLGCVELTGDALLLPPEKAAEALPDKQANLRFTSYGTLFFDEKTNGKLRTWLLNTACADNMAGSRYAADGNGTSGTVACDIQVGAARPFPVTLKKTEGGVVDADGVLGHPFFRQMLPLRIDFRRGVLQSIAP